MLKERSTPMTTIIRGGTVVDGTGSAHARKPLCAWCDGLMLCLAVAEFEVKQILKNNRYRIGRSL